MSDRFYYDNTDSSGPPSAYDSSPMGDWNDMIKKLLPGYFDSNETGYGIGMKPTKNTFTGADGKTQEVLTADPDKVILQAMRMAENEKKLALKEADAQLLEAQERAKKEDWNRNAANIALAMGNNKDLPAWEDKSSLSEYDKIHYAQGIKSAEEEFANLQKQRTDNQNSKLAIAQTKATGDYNKELAKGNYLKEIQGMKSKDVEYVTDATGRRWAMRYDPQTGSYVKVEEMKNQAKKETQTVASWAAGLKEYNNLVTARSVASQGSKDIPEVTLGSKGEVKVYNAIMNKPPEEKKAILQELANRGMHPKMLARLAFKLGIPFESLFGAK